MTTLRDRPDPGTAGAEPTGHEAAHCPHCEAEMATGVDLPWPAEPVLCASCERWVGRARAISALAAAAPGPDPAAGGEAEGPVREPRSRLRRRAPRPRPTERRRARELGPPPVPRFSSAAEPEQAEDDLDLHDDGFAVTSAWDAPASVHGLAEPVPPAPDEARFAETEKPASEPWRQPQSDENGAAADPWAEDGHGAPFAAAPTEFDQATSTWPEDHADEGEDDLGPPAPFYVPSSVSGIRNGSSPVPEAEPVAAAEAPPETPEAQPLEILPRPGGSGHTLPFWSVPSQPERPRRRLSLRNLRRPHLRRPRFGRPTRAGLMRALPIVLLVVGGLLLLEGALTVLWKEPFSALFAAQSQSALGDDLDKLERDGAAAEAAAKGRKAAIAYQRRRSVSLNRDAGISKPIGRLKVDKIDLNTVVVQGTDEEVSLKKGPGHYTETPLPGQKGNWTVGIAGHRTTYDAPFRNINKLKRGDDIVFSTPYGKFTYAVEGTEIVDDSETGVFQPKGYDRIALTACHPLYSAAQRIIAYGKLKKSEPLGKARRVAGA